MRGLALTACIWVLERRCLRCGSERVVATAESVTVLHASVSPNSLRCLTQRAVRLCMAGAQQQAPRHGSKLGFY
jgi:hypothetical protein